VVKVDMIEFMDKYGTEEQCRQHLFNSKWSNGFICPKCGRGEYFNIKSRALYQCKSCNHQASVTAGTIMDKTRTPLRKWLLAMYYMSEDKRGISAAALKGKIKAAYQTAWSMCRKIRYAMSERDKDYKLTGIAELDEAFFGSPAEGGKRGRGTDKTAVFASVSLAGDGKPGYAKMKVAEMDKGESADSGTAVKFAEESIAKGSEIRTDGLNIYNTLKDNGYIHAAKNYDAKNQPEHLHWTHIIISNAKAFIAGTFHGLDSKHLQLYLNGFCYRLNRRWFESGGCFRLVKACALSGKITYHELIG
jgi:transposase-like protein